MEQFDIIKIGLEEDRSKLYDRIDQRMDQMIEAGLFGEAERLLEFQHLNALQTVGYKEIFGFLNGDYDKEETIRLLKRNSRRYAKRQMTWYRRYDDVEWFEGGKTAEIIDWIEQQISTSRKER